MARHSSCSDCADVLLVLCFRRRVCTRRWARRRRRRSPSCARRWTSTTWTRADTRGRSWGLCVTSTSRSVPTSPSHQRSSSCLYPRDPLTSVYHSVSIHVTFISVHHHLSWTENSLVFQSMWKKDFTLEFSRDRKSMSCCATPIRQTKLGPGPKFFVKVYYLHPCVYKHLLWKRWWGRRTMMWLFCVVGRSRGRAGQMYLCARRYPEGSHDTSPQSGDHEARQVLRNRCVPCGELHHVIKLG